jgi:hypothetical protein
MIWFENFGKYLLLTVVLYACGQAFGAETNVSYHEDFEKLAGGKLSDDFLVLAGNFEVKRDGTNNVLELPGAPLDTFSLQFGPTQEGGAAAGARIRGTTKGRRYPAFGVGVNGVAGFKIQVSPAKGAIELLKDMDLMASHEFVWQSGRWVFLRIQTRKGEGGTSWIVEARAWMEGSSEPSDWMLKTEVPEAPPPGRASVFGCPFSGTPIQFDDFEVRGR